MDCSNMVNYSRERKLARCVSNAPNQSVYFNYPRSLKRRSNCDARCVSNAPNQSLYFNYPRREKRRSNCEDQISSLPDDILVDILSLLKDFREAARTSVLSKKWQHLWYNVPNYDFTPSRILAIVHDKVNVAYFVNKVVSSSRASSINRFKVHRALDATSNPWISKWLDFAMTKSVKELELNFSAYVVLPLSDSIRATLPSLRRYATYPSVHTLVSLTLKDLCVTTDFFESLLFNFTNLERLTIKRVFCVEHEYKGLHLIKKNLKTKVVCSFLKLRHLEISMCPSFGEIEISAEKLTSLVYVGETENIKFSYVPLLNDAAFNGLFGRSLICNYGIISGFSSQLSRLKLVTVEIEDVIQRPLVIPNQFGNLKEFELFIYGYRTESLLHVTNFIDVCPLLHKLKLERMLTATVLESDLKKWNWKEKRDKAGFAAMKHHHCFNIFEMVGFIGAKVDIELILLLTQEAIPLEKIILYPNHPSHKGVLARITPNQIEIARKEAGLLRNHIPPRVQMEFSVNL